MQIKGSKYTIFGTHQIALTDYYYVLALKIASCIYLYLFSLWHVKYLERCFYLVCFMLHAYVLSMALILMHLVCT